jgi:lysophospholipase L1-like esterase
MVSFFAIVIFVSYSIYGGTNVSEENSGINNQGEEIVLILKGFAFSEKVLVNARVSIYDFNGEIITTVTDKEGFYSIDVTNLKQPLLVDVVENGVVNCSDASKPRGRSVSALINNVVSGVNIANVNPLTDKVVSDVALKICVDTTNSKYLKGPQGLVDVGNTSLVDTSIIESSTKKLANIFSQTLKDAGVKNVDSFDALTYNFALKDKLKNDGFVRVLSLIYHNRGYDSATGKVGDTILLDPRFRQISELSPLNFRNSEEDAKKIKNPSYTRVFITGDSTACNYDVNVAPRMGWGQVLQTKLKENEKVIVLNVAQSGRSSRSFINEGWLGRIESIIKPGDYLFVQFGHNDEKCGGSNPAVERDPIDIANLGTYPNDASGNIQGTEDMSFQRSLEKYINLAKSKKATTILMTPVTRVKLPLPIIASSHITKKGLYYGDYSQTVRDTALANNTPLVDMDKLSMEFLNSLADLEWKNYWLAVDPLVYPYYTQDVTGNINKPDTTHFQENGALKMCDLMINDLDNSDFKELKRLKSYFKIN